MDCTAQRQLSAAPLAGVKTGTAAGTARQPKIAPSPEAAPAASAAKQCWAAMNSDQNTKHFAWYYYD